MVFVGAPHTWMIWPEFLRDDGSPYELYEAIPIDATAHANMYVMNDEVRPLVRPFVHVGRKVHIVEGACPVAVGEVTAVKDLSNLERG